MLFLICKQIYKERHFQIDKAYHGKPDSHCEDLSHHFFAYNTFITFSRCFCHIFFFCRFIAKHHRSQSVHDQIYKEKMCYFQWFIHTEKRCDRTDHNGCHVDHQLEFTEFQDVMVDGSSIEDGIFDGFKIIIQNNDLTCFFCCFCSASHGKTNICTFQCR